VSVRLQTISKYLELLSLEEDSKEYKKLSTIYSTEIHSWAMEKVLKIAKHIDRSGARVRVSQRKLDAIRDILGIEAIEYSPEVNDEPDSKDCNNNSSTDATDNS